LEADRREILPVEKDPAPDLEDIQDPEMPGKVLFPRDVTVDHFPNDLRPEDPPSARLFPEENFP
jgi:hypothetical protein